MHRTETDFSPVGAAVVIDDRRLLTCRHVADSAGGAGAGLWVAFPNAPSGVERRLPVVAVRRPEPESDSRVADVAVLVLAEPVPAGVVPARLRAPAADDLRERESRWWAFGFPKRDPIGNSADGTVGEKLGYGWVRLDTKSEYLVEAGFSGGGLWSADYEAVVGIVGAANDKGDGQALTVRQAVALLPEEKLDLLCGWSVEAAGEVALASWGWSLATDVEAVRHWRPRARGVSVDSERGYRFRGRTRALSEIVSWLARPAKDHRVLVVTGSPGVGKSAVLGRIVTTADAELAAVLPVDDDAVRAQVGAVSCAVHVKGKTALDVAREVARAASAALPERVEDLMPALRRALENRTLQRGGPAGSGFNLVVDALDEAASPGDARTIIDRVVKPIAQTCADLGAQVLLGSRRTDSGGDLLHALGEARVEVDLDRAEFFSLGDLTAYAEATLRLRGQERPDSPYADGAVAGPVARRIAALAERNFLVAGLVARAHGLYDRVAVDPASLAFPPDVEVALTAYLDRAGGVGGVTARDLLAPLAYAEAPGLTLGLWAAAVRALTGRHIGDDELSGFAVSAAAAFLVESSSTAGRPVFRLFHQALNDALRAFRARLRRADDDDTLLTRAFLAYGRRVGWADAPDYLLRSLPGHAVRASVVDDLLAEDDYLLTADLLRLIPAADHAESPGAQARARLLRLTPRAVTAAPSQRAALFGVTETLEHIDTSFRTRPAAYHAVWAQTRPRVERGVLEGHTNWVRGVCAVEVGGRTLLASAGDDGTVRLWDPASGMPGRILKGHTGWVRAVCAVEVRGQTLLASAGDDGTVRLWDPASGRLSRILKGHTGRVNAVCPVEVGGRILLASAGDDGTVRLWDPASGMPGQIMKGHTGWVLAVCAVEVGGRTMLASAGDDRTVRLWEPVSGALSRILEGHKGRIGWWSAVRAVCSVHVSGRTLLASAGNDGTVRLWDLAPGTPGGVLEGHTGGVRAVCSVQVGGRTLLASAGGDRTVRLWEPMSGALSRLLEGHTGNVNAVCSVQVGGRTLLSSAGNDGTVRLWDPATGTPEQIMKGNVNAVCSVQVGGRTLLASAGNDGAVRLWDPASGRLRRVLEGHTRRVMSPVQNAVCSVEVGGRTLLASAGNDGTVRLWDPASGGLGRVLEGHTSWVRAVCSVQVGRRTLLASACDDRTVRLWDPATGRLSRVLEGHTGGVNAVCSVQVGGRTLLASASDDRTVRLWDPAFGGLGRVLEGHTGWVYAVCAVQVDGRTLLASAGDDRTVRLWNPATGFTHQSIPVHHEVTALTILPDRLLAIGLSAGILTISFP